MYFNITKKVGQEWGLITNHRIHRVSKMNYLTTNSITTETTSSITINLTIVKVLLTKHMLRIIVMDAFAVTGVVCTQIAL